ncbi:MAG: hypothetical protein LBB43_01670 [Spirochaetaceae bacterium]|jgi:hypothetical protein|nr:hypothetical protein [Spirochaetaceae bacterium]
MADYVPSKDADFSEWVKLLLLYVQAHLTAFNISSEALQPVLALQIAFDAAYAKTLDPNKGSVDVAEKNRTRQDLTRVLRAFIKGFLLYNPLVSSNDRDKMKIPTHATTHSPVPKPSTFPEYSLDSSVPNRLALHFWDSATKRRGKPRGVHGAEIRWEIKEEPPIKAEDLFNSDFATKTPCIFDFTGDKRGKTVYFCARWENPTGSKGPWGTIANAIIP